MAPVCLSARFKVASEHCSLCLDAKHTLSIPEDSGQPTKRVTTTTLLKNVKVVLLSPLVVSIIGSVNREDVDAQMISRSHIARHLRGFLSENSHALGIHSVSGLSTDQDDSAVKFHITSEYHHPLQDSMSYVELSGIALHYRWCIPDAHTDVDAHPFSTELSLPYMDLLNKCIHRLLACLVTRYPYIFGGWRRQLDLEKPLFSVIFKCISNIIARSANDEFRSRCERFLEKIRRQRTVAIRNAAESLAALFSTDNSPAYTHPSAAEAFSLALESMYCKSVKPSPFKSTASFGAFENSWEDEQLLLSVSDDKNHISEAAQPIVASSALMLLDMSPSVSPMLPAEDDALLGVLDDDFFADRLSPLDFDDCALVQLPETFQDLDEDAFGDDACCEDLPIANALGLFDLTMMDVEENLDLDMKVTGCNMEMDSDIELDDAMNGAAGRQGAFSSHPVCVHLGTLVVANAGFTIQPSASTQDRVFGGDLPFVSLHESHNSDIEGSVAAEHESLPTLNSCTRTSQIRSEWTSPPEARPCIIGEHAQDSFDPTLLDDALDVESPDDLDLFTSSSELDIIMHADEERPPGRYLRPSTALSPVSSCQEPFLPPADSCGSLLYDAFPLMDVDDDIDDVPPDEFLMPAVSLVSLDTSPNDSCATQHDLAAADLDLDSDFDDALLDIDVVDFSRNDDNFALVSSIWI
ncbi:hypothetical protein FISHEDRAFT_68427 [Fistulina hepatica ATCC 64428]|uniref:Uncharacterized protein n=1 Tax=Fistulina hepatica ATCC 64428 TaxID=1128425 RepID=A0A0D7AQP2_9AGAR|nr:hypothetical protein FISHEDRAFT_68427 [Fistulina hepatica ATCC 64428]